MTNRLTTLLGGFTFMLILSITGTMFDLDPLSVESALISAFAVAWATEGL